MAPHSVHDKTLQTIDCVYAALQRFQAPEDRREVCGRPHVISMYAALLTVYTAEGARTSVK
jgi:hypothetical protein